jgi:hypothetical protein
MTLYSLADLSPSLAEGAWAAPSADLIGDVRLGARASVWFGAILRGDNTPLILGPDTNFQDGAIGHSDAGFPLTIGARVTVGHQAILHGCTIEDDVLIGMGAKVLNGAVIASDCRRASDRGQDVSGGQPHRRQSGARDPRPHRCRKDGAPRLCCPLCRESRRVREGP